MNTKTKFVELVEMLNSIAIAFLMLAALKVVLNGIGENYTMIFGAAQMTYVAIEDIVRSLGIAVPMAIGGWAGYFLVRIWCRTQRKLEEEREAREPAPAWMKPWPAARRPRATVPVTAR